MTRKPALVLAVVLGYGTLALAQEQRATIEGVVKDQSRGVLPGVTVEARSPHLLTATTAVTDQTGSYRFAALPPGTYDVTARLEGFTVAKVAGLELLLGQIKTVELTLAIAGLNEVVEVGAESPLIDATQSARATDLRDQWIEKLPRGRDFTTLVTQAAGVNDESRLGGISIDGSSSAENRFLIDGIETTSLVSGLSGKSVITDVIEEVQVKSSGYTAEYGGSTGGVINVITKSGTNKWSGDVGTYFSADDLNGPPRPTLRRKLTDASQAEYITFPKDNFSRWEPGGLVGGPLAKDKAWIFASYRPTLLSTERTVTLRLDNSTITKNQDTAIHYSSINLTTRLGDNARARIAVDLSSSRTKGLLPAPAGTDTPVANFDVVSKTPNSVLSGSVDYIPSSRLYFSIRGGYFFGNTENENVRSGPLFSFARPNIGLAGVPESLQRVLGFLTDKTNYEILRDKQSRTNVQADTTYHASFFGQHSLKGGVQVDRLANDVDEGSKGNIVTLFWNTPFLGQRGQFGYYRLTSNGTDPTRGSITSGNVQSTNLGLFVQDAWTVTPRLTLNVGLRTENEKVPSFTTAGGISSTAINFGFADKLAPRAGVAWDLRGDGRWKAYASWGIFYDITKLDLPRALFGGDQWLEYWFTLETADWPNLVAPGCPPACPGRLLLGPIDFRYPVNDPQANSIDANIHPMRLQEAVAGIEHQLTNVLSMSARYIHKQIDKAVEDIGALDANQNEIYVIGNPGFGRGARFSPAGSSESLPFPKAVRDYDAFEMAIDKRLARNWALRASYVLSRLFGNYSGLAQSDENGRVTPNGGRNFDYPLMSFDETGKLVYGRLATDRPHQFKTQVLYDFPFGTSLGLNWGLASGVPITREAAFIPGNAFPVQYKGRLSDGRTPMFSQTDAYAQHAVRLGQKQRFQVSVNVLNLFDQRIVTNRFTTQLASGFAISVNEVDFYRGINTQQLIEQQRIPLDPRFLLNSEFQAPRTIRLGVSWLF